MAPVLAPAARSIAPRSITPCPSTWYLVGAEAELRPGRLLTVTVAGTELVLFRDAGGKAHALAAHCVHMGCHLKHGQVVEDRLRCPLHFREFDGAGRCRALPGGNVSDSAMQPTYLVIERYGGIFVFIGSTPAFDLSQPHGRPIDDFVTQATPAYEFQLPWYALIANGCDLDHLQTVHLRKLREPPQVEILPPNRFRIRYRTKVIGKRLADRLMRYLSGDDIRATITCIGGSLMMVESTIRNRESFLFLSMRPLEGYTSVRGIVGLDRRGSGLLDHLRVRLATWLFMSFLRRDVGILDGQRPHRPAPIATDGDRYSSLLFDYFEGLDQTRLGLVEREVASR